MAIGDVYNLAVNQTLYGANIANVYAFEQLSDISTAASPEESLMEAWVENQLPLQKAMSVNGWAMTCLTARKVRPTSGVQHFLYNQDTGDILQEGNPATTCCIASLYSNLVGPRGRGRKFISGIGIDANDKGRLDTAALSLFDTFVQGFLQTLNWSLDNADFIIRILSTVDGIIRAVQSARSQVSLTKMSSRLLRVC